MAISPNGRQHGLFVVLTAKATDIAAGATIVLPPGAILVDGLINFPTALSGGTDPTVAMKDDKSAPTSIFGDTDEASAMTAGRGTVYPAGATLKLSAAGAPTGGVVQVVLQYIEGARTDEIYGA